jgi:hypothetical protein
MSFNKAVAYKDFEQSNKTGSMKKSELAGTLVKIQHYNPAHHSLKVVRLSDGKPLVENRTTDENLNKSVPFEQSNAKTFKTLAAPDSPILEVNDSEASLRGSSTTGLYSSREFGNIVKGPTSFSVQPHEMRVGGLQTFHPLLTSGFASTIVTPIPTFQWSLPTGAMLGPIAKDIALMSTLIGIIA